MTDLLVGSHCHLDFPDYANERLHRLYGDLLKIRATARHPLNELLFLEDLAARCVAALAVSKSR